MHGTQAKNVGSWIVTTLGIILFAAAAVGAFTIAVMEGSSGWGWVAACWLFVAGAAVRLLWLRIHDHRPGRHAGH